MRTNNIFSNTYIGRSWAVLVCAGVLAGLGCGDDDTPTDPREYPDPTPLTIDLPANFPRVVSPEDNPLTVEGVALGRRLFYDRILSAEHNQSCGDCHQQSRGFSDDERFSLGDDGVSVGNRNAPVVVNPAWNRLFFWDGRAASLEDQARGPVENPLEMNLSWEEAVARLEESEEYPDLFGFAFGDPEITEDRTVMAIAQFERTLVSYTSKWDKEQVDEYVFTESEQRGEDLFWTERSECFHCHVPPLMTNGQFQNVGLDEDPIDIGLEETTGDPLDRGKFKVPSLRNLDVTAPYMHDGRFETLEEVIRHYDADAHSESPNINSLILARVERGPLFTEQETTDLINFLRTFNDQEFLENPDFSDPFGNGVRAR